MATSNFFFYNVFTVGCLAVFVLKFCFTYMDSLNFGRKKRVSSIWWCCFCLNKKVIWIWRWCQRNVIMKLKVSRRNKSLMQASSFRSLSRSQVLDVLDENDWMLVQLCFTFTLDVEIRTEKVPIIFKKYCYERKKCCAQNFLGGLENDIKSVVRRVQTNKIF